jgi:hypothetical protein
MDVFAENFVIYCYLHQQVAVQLWVLTLVSVQA